MNYAYEFTNIFFHLQVGLSRQLLTSWSDLLKSLFDYHRDSGHKLLFNMRNQRKNKLIWSMYHRRDFEPIDFIMFKSAFGMLYIWCRFGILFSWILFWGGLLVWKFVGFLVGCCFMCKWCLLLQPWWVGGGFISILGLYLLL